MTLDMRNLGVSWTLHCWMHTLALADDLRLEHMIDQLLQDFLQVWPDDCSTQFVDECLPLLFSIFRYSKVTSSQAFIESNTLSLFINGLSLCVLFLSSRMRVQLYCWRIYFVLVLVGNQSNQFEIQP